MKRQQKKTTVLVMISLFTLTALFLPGRIHCGDLEPGAAPGSTMKTLDQIPPTWSHKIQCDGTACPRFELVLDGNAVLDKETGLVWEKSVSETERNWVSACQHCYNLSLSYRKGWRLPTVEELASLLDMQQFSPSLPIGHPFENVQLDYYWTSTTYTETDKAWIVHMDNGFANGGSKTNTEDVWCVRGGDGHDMY